MIRRDHGRTTLRARPSVLPTAWQDALDGLRPDGWPSGEEVPLDLEEIVRTAEARVTVPRGWDALLASSRREGLAVTAARWQRSPERVRQIEGRAWQQLRAHTRHQPWRAALWAFAAQPHAVQVRPDLEGAWALLVEGTRALDRPDVRTVRLAPGLWALYRGAAPALWRSATLPAGRVMTAGEAAAVLGLDEALLAVLWPAMRVWRTRDGDYAGHTTTWTSGEWLAALADVLTRAGQVAWEQNLLFRAYRTLPDAPEVEEATLKAALRRRFQRTEVPRVWRFPSGREPTPATSPHPEAPKTERPDSHARGDAVPFATWWTPPSAEDQARARRVAGLEDRVSRLATQPDEHPAHQHPARSGNDPWTALRERWQPAHSLKAADHLELVIDLPSPQTWS